MTDQFLEMPNIDKQREENPEYKVDGYEVVRSGRENKGASVTNNEHASGKCQANKNCLEIRRSPCIAKKQ